MRYLYLFVLLLAFVLGVAIPLQGQLYSNLRTKTIQVDSDTLLIDTVGILPGTIKIFNAAINSPLDTAVYTINHADAILIFKGSHPLDSIIIIYRVMPFNLNKTYSHKDTSLINRTPEKILDPFAYRPGSEPANLIDFGTLDYNGSFSRGISFGNSQNVVLNSNFNLQLSGKLTDDIELVAAMTDNNLPIQPDGNTQQIQDFDKVFIQLRKRENILTAGDFELNRPEGYFMNYRKKLQGINLKAQLPLSLARAISAEGSAAVSKGQYARMVIPGEEGNQGPYKLTGNNGETFIIVLAGTERVYIDGELLKRGADLDYVIDYNTGEVSFTPERLITKDKRITIEFEYSVQYYFRSLIQAASHYKSPKLEVGFKLYSEQDSKNQPVLQSLDSSRLDLISKAGDSLSHALFPGYELSEFNTDYRMYKKVDTTVNSISYNPVFIYSTNPDSALYRVSFSFVGIGKGNYIITGSTVNGRIYAWVAPLGNIPQGNYEPVIKLVTPETHQLATVDFTYKPVKNHVINAEIAGSRVDVNTLSALDDQDDQGLGIHLQYIGDTKLKGDSTKTTILKTGFSYEYAGENFRPLENYRPIEFVRDWNIAESNESVQEHLLSADISLIAASRSSFGYNFSSLLRAGGYKGFRHTIFTKLISGRNRLSIGANLLNADDTQYQSTFLRPSAEITRYLKLMPGWKIGFSASLEDNKLQPVQKDSLTIRSFSFYQIQTYLHNADTARNKFRIDFLQRKDKGVVDGFFSDAFLANTLNVKGALLKNPTNSLRWNFSYRQLNVLDTSLTKQKPEESLLGRVDYSFALWKGMIRSNTFFEAGSGQEQKREYTFIPVAVGQGTHIWNDDGDGIQELDEFEIASVNDILFANYLKILTPTNEYIRAYISTFNELLHFDPKVLLRKKKGILHFIGRFSNIASFQVNKKVLANNSLEVLNPFNQAIEDSLLVSINSFIRNTIFFNRSGSLFGAEFTYQDNQNKILLTNGPESRQKASNEIRVRWNMIEAIQLIVSGATGSKSVNSPGLPTRNYNYRFNQVEPKITFQKGNQLRLSLLYLFTQKTNSPEAGSQQAIQHQVTSELRFNNLSKSTLSAKFSFASITYNDDPRSSVAYAMLEGLQPGKNYIWAVGYEKKLAKNIQLSLSYDGRKAGKVAVTHVGRAQVRALF